MLSKKPSIFGAGGMPGNSKGDGGGGGGKKLLLLLFSLLKNSLLLSLDLIFKSLMLGALSKNLLKSNFFPMSTSLVKEPMTGFRSSSFCLKLASFSLSFVTHRTISPCLSSPNSLVARRYFLHLCKACFLQSPVENQSLEKNLYH